ncbi:hypothetical protein QBC43DRAFT_317706 [Cladorrhinum sp. PSN259]|nr:hypothetical protein QBC43DRAFT_317706 [Cladorrhinum sp. PSN259]
MAFSGFGGGGGGGGGFGANNNTTSGFSGFGAASNTTPAFGTGTPGFGATNNAGTTGTGLFGGGTTGGPGFGATANTTGGAFGGGFGAKPAFGTPTTTAGNTGMFGGTTTTTSGGTGFGFGNANNTTTTPFGGGGTSLFGAKPATTGGFGAGTTTGFGGASTGSGLFGGGATTGTGFGATTNPGIGTNIGDPPGTAVAQFTPFQEKEANNMSCSYQNLLFMDAYKKWSADELRLVDYNQGRKTGSPGGIGAFGASNLGGTTGGFGAGTTTTGGFGANTGTSLFGGGQTTGTGFGGSTAPTSTPGFGGGGLFGANKPATAGVFGGTTAQPAATGGLFGGGGGGGGFGTNTTAGTGGGFGTTAANTGASLFGNTASKPANTFSFGNTGTTGFSNTPTTNPAFGTNPATTNPGTGGLFGNTATNATGGGLFGNPQQQQQPATSGFGGGFGNTTQNTGTTGGMFGNTAAKPAGGLFGASTTTGTGTTGGLFGNTAGAATTTPFGGAAAGQPAGGGLFGTKPATTGGGLFGTGAATGTGAFGGLGANTQAQQPATGGLFGGLGQSNQQKPGGLFGASTATGGGMFGNTQTAQPQTNSMFGGSLGQQQQPQYGLGNSLLGASQGQQQAPQSFSTSINDISAYGASTLFSGLPDDRVQNPGPLATPLSGKPKGKSRSILPMYKLSPANASRFVTPQKRGYGFSVSAYGSPASPSSISSTPGGLGQSLLAGSSNRALSKSISASNLRRSINVEDSILQPGAFSANSSMRLLGNSNNHKKLVINKDMRSDLFTPPAQTKLQEDSNGSRKLSKRVSFETPGDAPKGAIADGSNKDGLGYVKPAPTPVTNGNKTSSANNTPEMEQVKGKELTVVQEEESPADAHTENKSGSKIEPGEYWMDPTPETIRAMNRMQRQAVPNFTVGRANVGSVSFKVPVDLNNINIDEIFDNIVVLVPRSATVYPVQAKKPPVGKGLNVPALISLEQSWPRGGKDVTGRRLEKHIEKLKTSIPDTTFESYDRDLGVWTFSVEHFTTYGLDDSDDDDYDEEETEIQTTEVAQPIPSSSAPENSTSPIDPDDTFEFKRSRRAVPGAFDQAEMSDDEDADMPHHHQGTTSYETLDADAPLPSREWPEDESMADGPDDYQLEAYDYSSEQGTVDAHGEYLQPQYDDNEAQVPAGILRARMRAIKKSTAPTKIEVAGGDDWTQILQASVRAPRTVDRAALRAMNESGEVWEMKDSGSPAPKETVVADGAGFATSIDLMKSLFEQAKGPSQSTQAAPTKGFVKWPYQKRSKVDEEEVDSVPRANWGPDERLVTTTHHGENTNLQAVDVEATITPKDLAQLQQYIETVSGYQGNSGPEFKELAQGDTLWEVASLLFDENGYGMPAFWKQLVSESTKRALNQASSYEERAIIQLAGHNVPEACAELLAGKNSRLAILVATIGSQSTKQDVKAQLKDWRDSNVLAEISEPVRAVYEILAGNACVCAGVKEAPIENRVASFTIAERFGLDWMQSFGLRLFYSAINDKEEDGVGAAKHVKEAVRSFQADIEQDRELEPDTALWSLLKTFANQEFDWGDERLGWLMTRAVHTTGKVEFGEHDAEKLDKASTEFAAALTTQGQWVPAAFVLLQLSDASARESAVREHLGRHAHIVGNPKNAGSSFVALKKFGVPEGWIWEAKALDFRARGETHQEFLALVWAENYVEANRVFINRVGPDLVIESDFKKLFSYAQLLFKVKKQLADWDRAGIVYLTYPMTRLRNKHQPLDRLDVQLFDGLLALRGQTNGDVRQEAAIAVMAEELILCRPITKAVGVDALVEGGKGVGVGGDGRLYELLPSDVRGKYMRRQALEGIC